MNSAIAVFLLLVFRAWALEPIVLFCGGSDVVLYGIYDAIPSLIGVFALKCVHPRTFVQWHKVGLDLMLAVLWADLIDRCFGIVEWHAGDWLLIPFLILAVMKHTILKPYLK